MSWKLFLDDMREIKWVYPNAEEGEFKLARDHWEVRQLIKEHGMPSFVAFDHDLGMESSIYGGGMKPSGYDVALELVKRDMRGEKLPDDFTFEVHSSNPAGAANIKGLLDNYLKFRKENPDMEDVEDDFNYREWACKPREYSND